MAMVLTLVAQTACAQEPPVSVELVPAVEPTAADASRAPYPPAVLTLHHAPSARSIRIRNAAGGPTRVYPLPPATDGRHRLRVHLPAIAPTEIYNIRFDADTEAGPSAVSAEIQWPAGVAAPRAFLDPFAHVEQQRRLPEWPASLRQTLLLVLAGVVLLAVATLLIPYRRWRMAGLLLVVLSGAGGAAWAASRVQTALLTQHENVLVVRCRRTHRALEIPRGWVPQYQTRRQFRDDSLVQPIGAPSILSISPGETRIFRRMGRNFTD
jgi:hypothetical protein